jgi:hypothetical protein
MEVVLVIASMVVLAGVAAAVALDRGPFAAPPPRPGTAGPLMPPGRPLISGAGRWAGRDASVRACDDLQAQLRAGRLSCADYRRAMADVAESHDRRHPLPIPPEKAS